jgi:TorA maturation chaperone TorD
MQAVESTVAIHRPLAPEEAARGDFYALLGRLFHAAPDGALLRVLAEAEPIPGDGDPALAKAWQDLVHASSAMDQAAAEEEFDALFGGVGKSQVSPYAGYYSGAPAIDHPRVRIQNDLAALGLGRRAKVNEPEDHFAGLFDVMRVLVAGGAGRSAAPVAEQRRFFDTYVKPGAAKFIEAVSAARGANYYRKVAALGTAFIAIETESFFLD